MKGLGMYWIDVQRRKEFRVETLYCKGKLF